MPKTPYAKNLHEIVLDTYRLCGDMHPDQTYGRIWTYAEVVDEINRAVLYCIDQTGGLRASAVIPVIGNSNIYDLPQDCIRPLRIGFSGTQGWVLLPSSLTSYVDLPSNARVQEGNPFLFYSEYLAPNQVGVIPTPKDSGSSFSRDSQYGLLRGIRDADGNYLPFDANRPLRGIRGVPFQRTGDGRIIREVISPLGNVYVYYVRSPSKMINRYDYPDPSIPEWIHKDIKYGAAQTLLRFRRNKLAQLKLKRSQKKWFTAVLRYQRLIETTGPMNNEARPM
jgi:hypothetical protein